MNWREEYQRKLVSAEDAAQLVKSGDSIAFTAGRETLSIGMAIVARKEELSDVKVFSAWCGYDFGWYDRGWDDSFKITIAMPTATSQEMVDERRCDINFYGLIPAEDCEQLWEADIVLTELSSPDDKGFCSFGASLWNKKRHIRYARERNRLVIAEVNKNLIRTYGDNFIHVSEIDYFVEHASSASSMGTGSLAGRELKQTEPHLLPIAKFVSELVRDGDTIQIGVGRTTEPLIRLGLLDGKCDIGYHSETTPGGVIALVRDGVINGKCKTINPGALIATSIGGGTRDEMEWINNNPLFWLVDVAYLEDIRVIASHDNMTCINNALAMDLTGQIAAESLGTRLYSLAGGQIPFVIGAWLSRGGRSITVLPSTAQSGSVSRIVPHLPEGTAVTIQRNLADYVVTEYGIARLKGKSIRQRINELINIAHPDFREQLWKEAKAQYWPDSC